MKLIDILGTRTINGASFVNLNTYLDFDKIINDANLMDYYVSDRQTPEGIALSLYGSTDYFWVILVVNKIKNRFFDFPMSDMMVKKYKADMTSWGATAADLVEFEELNDANRHIKVLKPELLKRFINMVQEKIKVKQKRSA